MSLCLVHRDRRGAMARIEKEFETIRSHGHGFISLNLDALSEAGQSQIISSLQEAMGQNGKLKMLLHSIAFGNLKPLAPVRRSNRPQEIIEELANKLGCDSGQLKMAVSETFVSAAAMHRCAARRFPINDSSDKTNVKRYGVRT